jgi:hypothetical protein
MKMFELIILSVHFHCSNNIFFVFIFEARDPSMSSSSHTTQLLPPRADPSASGNNSVSPQLHPFDPVGHPHHLPTPSQPPPLSSSRSDRFLEHF